MVCEPILVQNPKIPLMMPGLEPSIDLLALFFPSPFPAMGRMEESTSCAPALSHSPQGSEVSSDPLDFFLHLHPPAPRIILLVVVSTGRAWYQFSPGTGGARVDTEQTPLLCHPSLGVSQVEREQGGLCLVRALLGKIKEETSQVRTVAEP